jgi:hypothetical protein
MPENAKRLLLPLAAAGALLLLVVTAVAAAGSTAVTFSTPKAGSTISLHSNPYTAVAGGVSFAAANPQTTHFYLRRDGCGTSNDNPRLSTTGGTDAGDGCGLIVDSVVGVGGTADQAAFVDFPATDGMPLALDASRSVTGVIDITGTAAGAAQVDVSMEALVGGQAVALGSDSETAVLDPTVSDNAVAFTIHPDASLAGADLQGLDLRVHIQGPSIDGGFMGLSGKSWADVPSYTASVNRHVEISLDDPSFANAIPTRLGANGSSWSVALETPPVGKHTIYARSTQGYVSSTPTSTTFTIKR